MPFLFRFVGGCLRAIIEDHMMTQKKDNKISLSFLFFHILATKAKEKKSTGFLVQVTKTEKRERERYLQHGYKTTFSKR